MLSISKLRVGQEAYQLTGVARSLDDYYTGAGEASGWWAGEGAALLGLDGEVAAGDLRSVLAGMAPGSGGLSPNSETIRPHPRRVPGFDLTFKAPKSLSVLYAVSDDPRVQGAIIEACEAAVRSTLAWLEREAIRVRRGTGNERWLADLAARDPVAAEQARIKMLPSRGMAAAVFRHRTSRAGDPLLHWHALVPNLVEGPDGRWSAFVHPELYRHVRAAGEVFQAAVRSEAAARLGVKWRPGRHVPEVAGVPQALCDRFSKRSAERDAWLAATGTPADPAGRQEAVLATRRNKPELEVERFDAAWKAEALSAGWGPDAAEALMTGLTPTAEQPVEARWRLPEAIIDRHTGDPVIVDGLVEPDTWIGDLIERDLLDKDATFTRPDVMRAVAARLGEGATVPTVERIAARVFASPHVVPIHDQDQPNWTSAAQLARERRLLELTAGARGTHRPLRTRAVARALHARPGLGNDQAAAVCTVAETRDGVSVLVGPAGTGKTFTVATITNAFERCGWRVRGAAPSARAALELAADTNMAAGTLHRLLSDWSRGHNLPDKRTLLIIDEAAIAATAQLEPAIRHTIRAGGRVLLVGDHRQLPAVGAGGGFAAIATDPRTTVATLTVNRRQVEAWECDALAELRDGRVVTAVDAYRTHGRVIVAGDAADMIREAVERWFDAHHEGRRPVLLAGTNETVDALNTAARNELLARRLLRPSPTLTWANKEFVVGDRVVLRRNAYQEVHLDGTRTELINSQTGTVTDGGPNGLVVQLDTDPRPVVVPGHYVEAGNLDHAYALTTIRTQGGTWDLAIDVGLDGLYREAAYVGLSRGAQSNWLILTQAEIERVDAELARHQDPHVIPLPGDQPDDIDTELRKHLELSRTKLLALARDAHADHVAELAVTTALADLEGRARHCRAIEHDATHIVGIDPRRATSQVARAQHTARHLAIGQRIKAHDRGNIGTIVGYDDHTGTVTVHLVSPEGYEAERDLSWSQVEIVVPQQPDPRDLPPEAEARLNDLLEPIRQQLQRWHAHLTRHGVGPLDAQHHERAAELVIDRAAAQLTSEQPDWLQNTLGSRPATALCAHARDETVRDIAAHRARHHAGPDAPGLGPPPEPSPQRQEWEQVTAQAARTRLWIDTYTRQPASPLVRSRSIPELQQRAEELQAIFATAPPDQRGLVNRLTSEHVTLETTAELLDQALAAQDARRAWILAHWPHVVEHAEIAHTLAERSAGPDLHPLLDHLLHHTGAENDEPASNKSLAVADSYLTRAAHDRAPWLLTLLGAIVPADADHIDAPAFTLLTRIAGYRHRWNITHPDPVGPAATTREQAIERSTVADALQDARTAAHGLGIEADNHPHRAPDLDDSLSL